MKKWPDREYRLCPRTTTRIQKYALDMSNKYYLLTYLLTYLYAVTIATWRAYDSIQISSV